MQEPGANVHDAISTGGAVARARMTAFSIGALGRSCEFSAMMIF